MDALGNWKSNTLNGTAQAREHTAANEVSTINSSSSDVAHDLAGNMTKLPRLVGNDANGHYMAVYDAWNRLIKLQSDESTPTVYETLGYDGRGRRISKAITNSNNWNCVYHYYLDGDSMIEVRNGSDMVIKQQVWGTTYIDELIQQGINSNPMSQSTCDTFYWTCQDANFNVGVLVDNQGVKVERYAYTPYGVRTAYKATNTGDSQLTLAIGSSQAVMVGGVAQPYGLCEFGHQGLPLDELSNIYDNRGRPYVPVFGRFPVRDPIGYPDGMSLYQYLRGNPVNADDPDGRRSVFVGIWINNTGDAYTKPTNAWFNTGAVKANFQTIMRPFASSLTCDKVTFQVADRTLRPPGIGEWKKDADGKKIQWDGWIDFVANTTYLGQGAGGVGNMGYNNLKDIYQDEGKKGGWNWDIIYANMIAHEPLWHGMLGHIGHDGDKGDFSATDQYWNKLAVLRPDDIAALKEEMDVK